LNIDQTRVSRMTWHSLYPSLLLLSAAAALSAGPPATAEEPVLPWIAEGRSLSRQLGGELKAELEKAMAEGGPIAAIGVCRERAPAIAARLSAQSGARVGRTALEVRNPANAPDGIERALLEQFESELASGKFAGPLEAAFEINRGGQVERRYMRAIPTEAVCVTCHGKQLAPDLAAAIVKLYPDDQATGFEPGRLRGAFSVVWPPVMPPDP
jgi:hypothetical protein